MSQVDDSIAILRGLALGYAAADALAAEDLRNAETNWCEMFLGAKQDDVVRGVRYLDMHQHRSDVVGPAASLLKEARDRLTVFADEIHHARGDEGDPVHVQARAEQALSDLTDVARRAAGLRTQSGATVNDHIGIAEKLAEGGIDAGTIDSLLTAHGYEVTA